MTSPTVEEDSFNNDIPVGNATIAETVNISSNPDMFKRLLTEHGVDLNKQNILLSTAKLSWGNRTPFRTFVKDGKSLTILRPNKESVDTFLMSEIVQQAYLDSEDVKHSLVGTLMATLDVLVNSDIRRPQKITKAIKNSADPGLEFIRYFYNSSQFVKALKENGVYYDTKKMLEDLADLSELYAPVYSDWQVKNFAEEVDDGRISVERMNEIQKDLGVEDPITAVQLLNNKIEYGPYFEIKFIGKKEILFKKAKRKPLLEMTVVNSEYYGESVTPVATINGYNIVEYDGKYFISDKIITTVEDLGDRAFNSLNQARGYIEYTVSRDSIALSGYRNQVKQGNTFESRRKDLNVGDRFVVTDVKLGKYGNYPGNKILSSWNYGEFFSKMKEHPLWKHVVNNLAKDGISIENILTTPEKIETFLALQDKLADKERYKELYNRNTPRIDTPEKIEYSTNLAKAALDVIQNAKEAIYEIVSKNGTKYGVERVSKEPIPVYTKKTASFKQELVVISEYLQNNFGVKTNLLTAREISDQFKSIIPNANRANAFIYNNEIYINIDKATTADALHEYAHIVMGTIKQSKPDLYYGLLDKIEEHPLYSLKLQAYKGDKRARTDLNEEIFVDIFGEYCARRMNPWFNDKTVQLDELKEKFKQGTQKMLQTGDDISGESAGRLLHMSINDIMGEFGSTLSEKDPEAFNMDLAYQSRVVSNLISKLMSSNNPDTNLIENCE